MIKIKLSENADDMLFDEFIEQLDGKPLNGVSREFVKYLQNRFPLAKIELDEDWDYVFCFEDEKEAITFALKWA